MRNARRLFETKVAKPGISLRKQVRVFAFISAAITVSWFYRYAVLPHVLVNSKLPQQTKAGIRIEKSVAHQVQRPAGDMESGGTRPGNKPASVSLDKQPGHLVKTRSMPHVPEASLRPAEQRAQPASKGSQAAVPLLSIASTDPVMPALSKGSSRPRPRAAAQPQDRRGERAEQTSIKGAGTGAAAAPRTRSRPKEKVLDGDMAKAAAVVDGLVFPKTAKWRRRAPRIVVNKKDSEDKFIKSKAYVSSLPAEDLRENRHKTCAVVGNGGAMLSKPWGSSIDRHDAVFRFNDGPTEGFERHVGSKTTYRLTNNKWTHFYSKKHPRGASEENIVLFGHGSAGLGAHLVHEFPGESVLLLAPEFASQARGQYKQGQAALSSMGVVEVHGRNSAPTGIEGIFMALALCQRVHLYGFGVERDPSVPYHYHDKVRGVEAAHSFGFQALLLKLLKFRDIFALCVPGHDTEECLSPELSDPSAYDRAVKSMESAGGGAARGSSLRGRGTTPAADDEP